MNPLKQTTLKMNLVILLIGATLLLALGQTRPAYAATIAVDDVNCKLHEAIASANNDDAADNGCVDGSGADIIDLQTDMFLETFLPHITSEITLEGNGHTIDAGSGGGVLFVESSGDLTLHATTITRGFDDFFGSAITNNGTVTINNSTLSENQAGDFGGAIFNSGTLTINNSTLSGNHAFQAGGGIYNASGGTVMLNNSTLSGNNVGFKGQGGGIFNASGSTLTVNNSTLSGNSADGGRGGGILNGGKVILNRSLISGNSARSGPEMRNARGSITADNFNVFGYGGSARSVGFTPGPNDIIPPGALDTLLADNGGPTFTRALISGSVAIDTAPDAACINPPINGVDQRGEARNMDGNGTPSPHECDAGSFEYTSVPATDCAAVTQVPQAECEVLLALYNSTNGANWTNHTHWLDFGGNAPCDWYGVACSVGHVTTLNLDSNQLSGPIPPELGNLNNLLYLTLDFNQLSGPIPPELGNLTQLLVLTLYVNQLSGPIPPELGNLTQLVYLLLGVNQLSGPIPPELGNLTDLYSLYLGFNQLSGPIPPGLGNLTDLTHLDLLGNQLSGPIPPQLGNLTLLIRLDLSSNQLSGPIPPELGNLTDLESLYLSHNQLSGPLPPEFSNLTNLEKLYLSANDLSGSLPLSLTELTNLSTFWFIYTSLCEPADEFFQIWLNNIPDLISTEVICG